MGDPNEIKRVRNRAMFALARVYPNPRTAESLMRSLLGVFPELEWGLFCKDLAYLAAKRYIERVIADEERRHPELTSHRERWYRLTAIGLEVAQECVTDPALEV